MLIVHLDFFVAAEARPAAIAALMEERAGLTDPGAPLMFRPLESPEDPRLIVLVEEWASAADFAAYTASAAFAATNALLRPMAAAPPVSRRYTATLMETVN